MLLNSWGIIGLSNFTRLHSTPQLNLPCDLELPSFFDHLLNVFQMIIVFLELLLLCIRYDGHLLYIFDLGQIGAVRTLLHQMAIVLILAKVRLHV